MWKNIFLHVTLSTKSSRFVSLPATEAKQKLLGMHPTPVLDHSGCVAVGSRNFHIFAIPVIQSRSLVQHSH